MNILGLISQLIGIKTLRLTKEVWEVCGFGLGDLRGVVVHDLKMIGL